MFREASVWKESYKDACLLITAYDVNVRRHRHVCYALLHSVLLENILLLSDNIQRDMAQTGVETRVDAGFHVQCPVLPPHFSRNCNMSTVYSIQLTVKYCKAVVLKLFTSQPPPPPPACFFLPKYKSWYV
jgi:hypothetical protein